MKKAVCGTLLVISIISFMATVLFLLFGLYDDIFGPGKTERILSDLNISLTYNQLVLIGMVSIAVMMLSHFLRKRIMKSIS